MYIKFFSRLSRLGSLLRPDEVEVTDTHVTHYKRNANLITDTEVSIPRDKIAGIKIHNKIIGTEVTIYGFSGNTFIHCDGFDATEAKILQCILNNAWGKCSDQELLDMYNKERDIEDLTKELMSRNIFIDEVFKFY